MRANQPSSKPLESGTRLARRWLTVVVVVACTGCARTANAPTSTSSVAVSAPISVATMVATALPTQTATSVPTETPGATACSETTGHIVRSQIESAALGKMQDYRVYLPPCYNQQEQSYPVVYLLHGAGHNDGYWDDVGVDEAANPLIANNAIPPLIIVLPDGNRTFGSRKGNPPPYAKFLLNELVPQIDATYRTLADRDHRAIGGISLGETWALIMAEQAPQTFGAVGGHSPAIGRLNGIYPDANAFATGHVHVYLDVGEDDSLRAATSAFDNELTQIGYAHEFHVYPGGHTEPYWTSHLEEYLRFYTELWKQ